MILMVGTDRLNARVFDPQTASQNIEDHRPEPHQPIAFNPFKHDQKQRPNSEPQALEQQRLQFR
jgi:hypothetical protein